MTDQIERARTFHALHVKGNPIVLYNAWDPGSAKIVEKAGRQGDRHRKLAGRGRLRLCRWREDPAGTGAGQHQAHRRGGRPAGDHGPRGRLRRRAGGRRSHGDAVRCRPAPSASISRTRSSAAAGLHDIAVQVKRIEAAAAGGRRLPASGLSSTPAPISSSRQSRMRMTRGCSTRHRAGERPMKRPARAASLRRVLAMRG